MGEPIDYMKSNLHAQRLENATRREVDRLVDIGKVDLDYAMSEAIGTLFGIGHFFKKMGLKRIWPQVSSSLFKYMKSGTDV